MFAGISTVRPTLSVNVCVSGAGASVASGLGDGSGVRTGVGAGVAAVVGVGEAKGSLFAHEASNVITKMSANNNARVLLNIFGMYLL
jgi:hypothetical protein